MKILLKLGVYFIVLMGVMIICTAISNIWQGADSRNWPSVSGEIIVSKITSRSTYNGSRWQYEKFSEILYAYEINGVIYRNSRVTFDGSYREFGDGLSKEFPLGKKVRVFYDPENPDICVLFTGRMPVGKIIGMALMGVCITILGIFGVTQLKNVK